MSIPQKQKCAAPSLEQSPSGLDLAWYESQETASEITRRVSSPNICVRTYGFGPEGERCKNCARLLCHSLGRNYYKCTLRGVSASAATDHRVNWPACARFEPKGEETPPSPALLEHATGCGDCEGGEECAEWNRLCSQAKEEAA